MAELTNRAFKDKNTDFNAACAAAHVEPTKRQASKFRNKKGLAYKEGRRVAGINHSSVK